MKKVYVFVEARQHKEYQLELQKFPEVNLKKGATGICSQRNAISQAFSDGTRIIEVDDDIEGLHTPTGHFQESAHAPSDLRMMIIDKIPARARVLPSTFYAVRLRLEAIWTARLRASLNIRTTLHHSFPGASRARRPVAARHSDPDAIVRR